MRPFDIPLFSSSSFDLVPSYIYFPISLSCLSSSLSLSLSIPLSHCLGRVRFLTLRYNSIYFSRLKEPTPSLRANRHRITPFALRRAIFYPSVLFSRRKKEETISLFLFVLSLMLRECGNPLVR